ncbi:hypothetical protein ABIE61_000312 [Marinobacterium sp. MBR-111]|uniref:hypothetical protein n=1 Tax=Marinobacterium sp. MBR-111 TaxID=3156463 RepID=UPI0033923833
MQTVEIHDHAKDDIRSIIAVDRPGALKVLALFEDMQTDAELQERLLDRKTDDYEETVDVMRWVEQFRQGNDLYRIKIWEPDRARALPYRVIYAYLPLDRIANFVVLGVIHRKDFNYEPDHSFTKRILHDYHDLAV